MSPDTTLTLALLFGIAAQTTTAPVVQVGCYALGTCCGFLTIWAIVR